MIDKDKLKDLPPREREEALRMIKETLEKELEEASVLSEEVEKEIETEKATENVEIPEAKPVDISKLFIPDADGLEASAQISQVKGEDFFADYGRMFDGLAEEGFYSSIAMPAQAEKIETFINPSNYSLKSKQDVEKSTASVGILEEVKKYSKG